MLVALAPRDSDRAPVTPHRERREDREDARTPGERLDHVSPGGAPGRLRTERQITDRGDDRGDGLMQREALQPGWHGAHRDERRRREDERREHRERSRL